MSMQVTALNALKKYLSEELHVPLPDSTQWLGQDPLPSMSVTMLGILASAEAAGYPEADTLYEFALSLTPLLLQMSEEGLMGITEALIVSYRVGKLDFILSILDAKGSAFTICHPDTGETFLHQLVGKTEAVGILTNLVPFVPLPDLLIRNAMHDTPLEQALATESYEVADILYKRTAQLPPESRMLAMPERAKQWYTAKRLKNRIQTTNLSNGGMSLKSNKAL